MCNHTISQKIGVECGFVDTALELDYISESAYRKEKGAAGLVSALEMFRCYQDAVHNVFSPEAYADILSYLYAAAQRTRHFRLSRRRGFPNTDSRAQVHFLVCRKLPPIYVQTIGCNFAFVIENLEQTVKENRLRITQVYLPLGTLSMADAVELLNERGYFLGGLLPRWFNQDGLLMQKTSGRPHFEQICLYSARAERLRDFIRNDWHATT